MATTFELAQEACSEDKQCEMFYDYEGRGKKFYLCHSPATTLSSSYNSILYMKKGKTLVFILVVILRYKMKSLIQVPLLKLYYLKLTEPLPPETLRKAKQGTTMPTTQGNVLK